MEGNGKGFGLAADIIDDDEIHSADVLGIVISGI